jgi:hypothetical protein
MLRLSLSEVRGQRPSLSTSLSLSIRICSSIQLGMCMVSSCPWLAIGLAHAVLPSAITRLLSWSLVLVLWSIVARHVGIRILVRLLPLPVWAHTLPSRIERVVLSVHQLMLLVPRVKAVASVEVFRVVRLRLLAERMSLYVPLSETAFEVLLMLMFIRWLLGDAARADLVKELVALTIVSVVKLLFFISSLSVLLTVMSRRVAKDIVVFFVNALKRLDRWFTLWIGVTLDHHDSWVNGGSSLLRSKVSLLLTSSDWVASQAVSLASKR